MHRELLLITALLSNIFRRSTQNVINSYLELKSVEIEIVSEYLSPDIWYINKVLHTSFLKTLSIQHCFDQISMIKMIRNENYQNLLFVILAAFQIT